MELLDALKSSQLVLKLVVLNHSFKKVSLQEHVVSQEPFFYLRTVIEHLFVLSADPSLLVLNSVKLHLSLLEFLNIFLIFYRLRTSLLAFSFFKPAHFVLQSSNFLTELSVLVFHPTDKLSI